MSKDQIRKTMLGLRRSLSRKRRQQAETLAADALQWLVQGSYPVLSFASFSSEISLWAVNGWLAQQGRLLLPKMTGEGLEIFSITDIKRDLQLSPLGILEPNPELCRLIAREAIRLVFVPGVAFDCKQERLGYGKGCYDRFLSLSPLAHRMGVGFKEQLFEGDLPTASHDCKLDALHLF